MNRWIGVVGLLLVAAQAHAQTDMASGTTFYPSCVAATDIIQGKRPAADSEEASRQVRQASQCFGAVMAIIKLAPLFKSEFAICPPSNLAADEKRLAVQMVLSITANLKNHPEQRPNNFHQTPVAALAAAWPCPK